MTRLSARSGLLLLGGDQVSTVFAENVMKRWIYGIPRARNLCSTTSTIPLLAEPLLQYRFLREMPFKPTMGLSC